MTADRVAGLARAGSPTRPRSLAGLPRSRTPKRSSATRCTCSTRSARPSSGQLVPRRAAGRRSRSARPSRGRGRRRTAVIHANTEVRIQPEARVHADAARRRRRRRSTSSRSTAPRAPGAWRRLVCAAAGAAGAGGRCRARGAARARRGRGPAGRSGRGSSRNISSPRSVRSTSIAGATVIRMPRNVCAAVAAPSTPPSRSRRTPCIVQRLVVLAHQRLLVRAAIREPRASRRGSTRRRSSPDPSSRSASRLPRTPRRVCRSPNSMLSSR